MKLKLQFFLAGFIIMLCHAFNVATAQVKPGIRDSLYSAILKETRIIKVTLPESYKPGSADKYDVLYALDGEGQEKILPAIQYFSETQQIVPPNIVISIYNTDRNRDFTPTNSENMATSGGAANFLTFLKTELMPYINKKYPSNNSNALFGHSFGGLFAMYAFLQEPTLFESFIACDPSFWWDNNYLIKQVAARLDSTYSNSNKSIFITGREGEAMVGMGVTKMDSVLKAKAIPGLNFKTVAYQDENHGTIVLKSIYDGLKYANTGYAGRGNNLIFYPENGIVLKDRPITIQCFSDPGIIRYTTDGTEPKLTSAKMQKELTLSKPAKLKLKAFPFRMKNEKVVTANYKAGEPWKPGNLPKNAHQGGWKYTYYKGEWEKMPDFKMLDPLATGVVDKNFEWNKLPSRVEFGMVLEAYVEIQEDGYHTFIIDADHGAKLYLDNKPLINYNGLAEKGTATGQTYIVPLKKGFYPVKIEYFRKAWKGYLSLKYVTPNTKNSRDVPYELLYYNR